MAIVLIEKLIFAQLVQKFFMLYETGRIINVSEWSFFGLN